jgi:hypothetical protein
MAYDNRQLDPHLFQQALDLVLQSFTAQLSPEIIPPAHPPLPPFKTLAGGATAMDDK